MTASVLVVPSAVKLPVTERLFSLPETLVNVLKCKNPRCISCCEQELDQVFRLSDREKREYRCVWCEAKAEL